MISYYRCFNHMVNYQKHKYFPKNFTKCPVLSARRCSSGRRTRPRPSRLPRARNRPRGRTSILPHRSRTSLCTERAASSCSSLSRRHPRRSARKPQVCLGRARGRRVWCGVDLRCIKEKTRLQPLKQGNTTYKRKVEQWIKLS